MESFWFRSPYRMFFIVIVALGNKSTSTGVKLFVFCLECDGGEGGLIRLLSCRKWQFKFKILKKLIFV